MWQSGRGREPVIRFLRGFARIWCCLIVAIFILSVAGIWWKDGIGKVFDVLSPFNVVNYIVTVVLLLPAIGASIFADRLSKRAGNAG